MIIEKIRRIILYKNLSKKSCTKIYQKNLQKQMKNNTIQIYKYHNAIVII